MSILRKLIVVGVAACGIAMATPAQAHWGHYYGHRHFWHGRWYGPGWWLPPAPVVVGVGPYYGPRVTFGFGGGFYGPGWYHGHYYRRHWRHW